MRQDVRDHIRKNYGFETRVEPCIECNGDNPNGCPRCGRVGIRTPDGAVYTRTVYSGEQSPTEPRAGECEFEQRQPHEWYCTVHKVTKVAGVTEPVTCDWSGSPDPADPDNYWIDDDTGERVSAATGERTNPRAQTATRQYYTDEKGLVRSVDDLLDQHAKLVAALRRVLVWFDSHSGLVDSAQDDGLRDEVSALLTTTGQKGGELE